MKVSVLVAVYNTAAYLPQCLDSLLTQTHSDLQIICIDDHSTDQSLEILHTYARKDSRIEVIALPRNVGPGEARNAGLQVACGECIALVDSDDWVADNTMEEIVSTFESNPQADCVLYSVTEVRDGRQRAFRTARFQTISGQEAFARSLDWTIHGWYAIRTSLHKAIPYDTSAYKYNDENTTRLHYLRSRQVACSNGIYFYRYNPASVSHTQDVHRLDYLASNKAMKEALLQNRTEAGLVNLYENVRWLNVIDLYLFYYKNRKHFTRPERAYALQCLKNAWKDIETHRLSKKNKFKPGYIPFRPLWGLFRIEEECYFRLRQWLHRL